MQAEINQSIGQDQDFLSQFCERIQQPEARLLWAVLRLAIQDAIGADKETPQSVGDEARAWLASDNPGGELEFSFSWTCEMLGLDSLWVREVIDELISCADGRPGLFVMRDAADDNLRKAERT